jgi:hypothetical protein
VSTLAAINLLALTPAAIVWIDQSPWRPGVRWFAAFATLLVFELAVAGIAGGWPAVVEILSH